jgi:hypothetical protein
MEYLSIITLCVAIIALFNSLPSREIPKNYQVEIRDLQRKVKILEDLWIQEKNKKYLPGTNIEITDIKK